MGSLTCALRDGRRSFVAGGDVANAITPADTRTAPPHKEAPARGASALARSVAESTIALNRIVVKEGDILSLHVRELRDDEAQVRPDGNLVVKQNTRLNY